MTVEIRIGRATDLPRLVEIYNHYVVNTIMPRHFIQTGAAAGMPDAVIQEIMAEVLAQVPAALEQVRQDLTPGFPQQILTSIGNGVLHRADLLRNQ